MPTTTESWNDARYRAPPGMGFDGVVRIQANGGYGTGVLLWDGRAVLTAAHLLEGAQELPTVHWDTTAGTWATQAAAVSMHPDHEPDTLNHDMALVWLAESAPVQAQRYAIYRGTDELGQSFTLVGYGMKGTGATGALAYTAYPPTRTLAGNVFELDAAVLQDEVGSLMAWAPVAGTQLLADFDSGAVRTDALGGWAGVADPGLGAAEGLIAAGDSGGPAFVDGMVAGIASYGFSLRWPGVLSPDVDAFINSSFGELASWQRVSAYQQWIDESMWAMYPDAPQTLQDVRKVVEEGGPGSTRLAYFWVEFSGLRANPEARLTLSYEIREGTARAWEDFLPVSGQLVIYPGQSHAVVPVEIVGDAVPEPDETLYLAVFNPAGAQLAGHAAELVAARTIVNDDFF